MIRPRGGEDGRRAPRIRAARAALAAATAAAMTMMAAARPAAAEPAAELPADPAIERVIERAADPAAGAEGAAEGAALDGPGFREAVEGWTLHYRLQGRHFGSEQYFEGGRALWRGADGRCLRGRWEARGEEICFAYEDAPGDWRCWRVRLEDGGVSARLPGDPPALSLREAARERAPLSCSAPDLGV